MVSAIIQGRKPGTAALPAPEAEVARARDYAAQRRAPATEEAYRKAWRLFSEWSHARGGHPERASAAVLGVFLAWMADEGYAPASIELYATGVRAELEALGRASWPAGRPPDEIRDVLKGIRRALARRTPDQKRPITREILLAMLPCVGGHPISEARDRALLLVGFAAALRASELVGLDMQDVTIEPRGMTVRLRTSKTDPEGRVRMEKAVLRARGKAVCPVAALENWLDVARIDRGLIWRRVHYARHAYGKTFVEPLPILSERAVTRYHVDDVVKRCARALGKDPRDYASHSLRSGLVTTAAERGRSLDAIMRQTGHRSVEEARKYIRHGSMFTDNVTEGLFDVE